MVARALWSAALPSSVRKRIVTVLALAEEDDARDWIAFWAGLHDLGKATPCFEARWKEGWPRLQSAGLPGKIFREVPHGTATAAALPELLERLGLPREVAGPVARTVAGHHGSFPHWADIQRANALALGGPPWNDARLELARVLKTLCGLDDAPVPQGDLRLQPWLLMVLAGLTSVADWIASDRRHFPFADENVDLEGYTRHAEERAHAAITRIGWGVWQGTAARRLFSFEDLFKFRPNPLQQAVIELAEELEPPVLVLVESPMGGGKTEAALYLADRWSVVHGQHGCYFALPTQATSNQMFSRVKDFLARRYPDEIVNLQLLHGHASLSAELEVLRANADGLLRPEGINGNPGYDGSSANVIAAEWFTRRKHGLLATFGTGTVDQALLSILQTRHFFVRLLGLTGKTVIIDEVHAYDAYMSHLLARLLQWLAHLGCSVVLLSATLPAARRQQLLASFAAGLAQLSPETTPAPYPRLTWCGARQAGARSILTGSTRRVSLHALSGHTVGEDHGVDFLADRLQEALRDGGCAAVICNTVASAQRVYQRLRHRFPAGEVDLFHARYLFRDRQEREQRTLLRFGPDNREGDSAHQGHEVIERPHRFVLVATQVIEQSLDLDFDLIVTELAPVDLLLQRAGRLHRHSRPNRPKHLCPPTLWLLLPETGPDGLPRFSEADTYVYERHILLRTWWVLRDRITITIPDDVEALVEAVYGDRDAPEDWPEHWRGEWQRSWGELQRKRRNHAALAEAHAISDPDPTTDLLERSNAELEEENPEVHASLQALTRLSRPTVQVVLLYETPDGVALDPLGDRVVDVGREPDPDLVRELLARSVTLSHPMVVKALQEPEHIPAGWRESPWLRHHRLVRLDLSGCAVLSGWRIRLDEELGVLVEPMREEGAA